MQFDVLLVEAIVPFGNDLEEFLQGECGYVQAELPALHLYPVGQYGIVLFYLVHQLYDVFAAGWRYCALAFHAHHLAPNTVEEGDDAMYERHLSPILGIAPLVVGHAPDAHLELFLQFVPFFLLCSEGILVPFDEILTCP